MQAEEQPRIIQLEAIFSETGTLTYAEGESEIPFAIQRVFWLYNLAEAGVRAGHAYHLQEQIIVAVSGSFEMHLHVDGRAMKMTLDRPDRGLYLPPRAWRELHHPRPGSVALIISSRRFDPEDYIRARAEDAASTNKPVE